MALQPGLSDLVGNPKDRFSYDSAQLLDLTKKVLSSTVMTLSLWSDSSGQTVQTQITAPRGAV